MARQARRPPIATVWRCAGGLTGRSCRPPTGPPGAPSRRHAVTPSRRRAGIAPGRSGRRTTSACPLRPASPATEISQRWNVPLHFLTTSHLQHLLLSQKELCAVARRDGRAVSPIGFSPSWRRHGMRRRRYVWRVRRGVFRSGTIGRPCLKIRSIGREHGRQRAAAGGRIAGRFAAGNTARRSADVGQDRCGERPARSPPTRGSCSRAPKRTRPLLAAPWYQPVRFAAGKHAARAREGKGPARKPAGTQTVSELRDPNRFL